MNINTTKSTIKIESQPIIKNSAPIVLLPSNFSPKTLDLLSELEFDSPIGNELKNIGVKIETLFSLTEKLKNTEDNEVKNKKITFLKSILLTIIATSFLKGIIGSSLFLSTTVSLLLSLPLLVPGAMIALIKITGWKNEEIKNFITKSIHDLRMTSFLHKTLAIKQKPISIQKLEGKIFTTQNELKQSFENLNGLIKKHSSSIQDKITEQIGIYRSLEMGYWFDRIIGNSEPETYREEFFVNQTQRFHTLQLAQQELLAITETSSYSF